MKPLAASNRHLGSASDRKQGVERNVRSSSAVEGISMKTFFSATSGKLVVARAVKKTARVKVAAQKK